MPSRSRHAALAFAIGVAACTPDGLAQATPEPTVVGEPEAAFVFLHGDPPIASEEIAIRLFQDNPDTGAMKFFIEPGERVVASGDGLPGTYFAGISELDCSGSVILVGGNETDALLRYDGATCELSPEGTHPAEAPHRMSAVSGRVSGQVPPKAAIRAVSLDEPSNPVPDPRQVDESGVFFFPSLLPGTYRFELLSGTVVLDQEIIQVVAGSEPSIQLGD